ncbi:Tripartite tricarboxylate transporter family receptor [compost metagenome]
MTVLQNTPLKEFPQAIPQNDRNPKSLNARVNLSVVVRSGTPEFIIDKLHAALQAGVKDEDFVKTVDMMGLGTVMNDPKKAKVFLQQETQRYRVLIEKSGLEKQ